MRRSHLSSGASSAFVLSCLSVLSPVGLPCQAGARKSAIYVADEFRRIGLRPGGRAGSNYQVFKIRVGYRIESELDVRVGGISIGQSKLRTDCGVLHLPAGKVEKVARFAFLTVLEVAGRGERPRLANARDTWPVVSAEKGATR